MTVHVAIWEHEYGDSVRVFARAADAEKWREEIAEEWWEKEMGERQKPKDQKQAADDYFREIGERLDRNEYFTVHTAEVEGLS